MVGPTVFRERMFVPFTNAFPDLRVMVEDVMADDSKAVVRWSAIATHQGQGLGIPPTRKSVTFQGITWIHIVDGKLMKAWQSSDLVEKIRSLSDLSKPVP
jgi:predicted ester cyclase